MRTRTVITKNSSGEIIKEETQGWWNSSISMAGLEPDPVVGIGGNVVAWGGWCPVGQWNAPVDAARLQCSASDWAVMLADELGVTPGQVINGIAAVLEKLEDIRLLPPAPVPTPPEEPEAPVTPPEEPQA